MKPTSSDLENHYITNFLNNLLKKEKKLRKIIAVTLRHVT